MAEGWPILRFRFPLGLGIFISSGLTEEASAPKTANGRRTSAAKSIRPKARNMGCILFSFFLRFLTLSGDFADHLQRAVQRSRIDNLLRIDSWFEFASSGKKLDG